MRLPLILCALTLAACATPQERCVLNATKELRTVDGLIAESEANLARGYAIEREYERRPRLTFCAGGIRSNVGLSFCRDTDLYVRDRPVALDPEAERRKLALLRERKARLEVASSRAVAACGS
jgi:hypothetical protein